MTAEDTEFEKERERMVATQIAARGVKDPAVLDAMRRVPRHAFIPPARRALAYKDYPIQIDCGQTISQPYMVALMTGLLELRPEDRVLEIGTGSGYQTAILAELAAEVISIERHEALADHARDQLDQLEYSNVAVLTGDGTLGCREHAPFDAILVTAGSPHVPASLRDQLAEGGRLVCPTGSRDVQTLTKLVRTARGFKETESIRCVFVPLIGQEGWSG